MAKLSKNKKLLKFEAGARYDAKTDSFSIYTTDEDFEGLPFKMNVISGSSSHNTLLEVMTDHGFELTRSEKSLKEEKLPENPVKYPKVDYFENLVPAGVKDTSGNYAYYDLSKDTFCYGLTNSGKTNFAQSIITGALSKDWDVTIVSHSEEYSIFSKFSQPLKLSTFTELEYEYIQDEYSERRQLIVFDNGYKGLFETEKMSKEKAKEATIQRIEDFKKKHGENISFLFIMHDNTHSDNVFDTTIEIKRFRGTNGGFLANLSDSGEETNFLLFEKGGEMLEVIKRLEEEKSLNFNLIDNLTSDLKNNENHKSAISQDRKKYPLKKYPFTNDGKFDSLPIGVSLDGEIITVDLTKNLKVKGDGKAVTKLIESSIIAGLKKTKIETSIFTENDFEKKLLSSAINVFSKLESLENLIFDIMTDQSKDRALIFCKDRDFYDTKSLKVIGILEGLSESKDNNFTFIMSDYSKEHNVLDNDGALIEVLENEHIGLYDGDLQYSYNKCLLKIKGHDDVSFYPYQIFEKDYLNYLSENRIPEGGSPTTLDPSLGKTLNHPFLDPSDYNNTAVKEAEKNVHWLEGYISTFTNDEKR